MGKSINKLAKLRANSLKKLDFHVNMLEVVTGGLVMEVDKVADVKIPI